jgi:hypothetical protein
VIRPRRTDSAADPLLVTGVLGAAALLRRLRALLAELAADGDRGADDPGDEVSELGDVVDMVLGLAALAAAIEHRLPDSPAPAAVAPSAEREPINLLVKELLR